MNAFPRLREIIESIDALDERHFARARKRLNSLTKPIGSLGELESIAERMIAIGEGPVALPLRKAVYVFAADHGVTEAGVSAYPKEVTAQMVLNFLNGGAAINVLSRLHKAELTVVDVGVDADLPGAPGLLQAKVRNGSRNMLLEAAMTEDELSSALQVGFDIAEQAHRKRQHLVAVGEMGIGNTTAASAITSALTGQPIANVTGRGAGLDDSGRNRKINVLRKALRKHMPSQGIAANPIEILRCVGGLEIAAMAGFMLGAASLRIAVVCDGFISTSAAALAFAIAPNVKTYLFAGHRSPEPGHHHLLKYLGLRPILNLEMRLGEGTGAVLAMPIIEAALRLYTEMATFESANVSGANG